MRANRRALLKVLEEQFNFSQGTIWETVHERLGDRKVQKLGASTTDREAEEKS